MGFVWHRTGSHGEVLWTRIPYEQEISWPDDVQLSPHGVTSSDEIRNSVGNAHFSKTCTEAAFWRTHELMSLLPSQSFLLIPDCPRHRPGERHYIVAGQTVRLHCRVRGNGRRAKFYYTTLVGQKQSQTIYSFGSNRELTGSLLRTGIMFWALNNQRAQWRILRQTVAVIYLSFNFRPLH